MKGILTPRATPFLARVCGLVLLAAVQTAALAAGRSTINPPPKLNIQEAPLSREVKAATSFAPVVKKVAPSVVNIYSTRTIREQPQMNPFFNDPFFRRFFGPEFDEQTRPRKRRAQSLGSGVIVSEDGYILTAN